MIAFTGNGIYYADIALIDIDIRFHTWNKGEFMFKVLIVDDNPNIRNLMSLLIRKNPDFQVSEAESVRDALSICSENKFNLIFLDHNVADGVGWIISDIIALDPERYGNPIIVAMSGSVLPRDAGKQHHNFSQFLQKPFHISDINAVLDKLKETLDN